MKKKAEESTVGPWYPQVPCSQIHAMDWKFLGECAFNELVISPHTAQDNIDVHGICTVLGIRGNQKWRD